MSNTKAADEYAYIAARLAEIEKEKKEAINAEAPKAWPMYAASEAEHVSFDYDPA